MKPFDDDELAEALACPRCRGRLTWGETELRCSDGHRYPVVDGIPVLIDQGAQSDHSRRQAEWFDSEDTEFEISRPHGTPRLYRWLMNEKFRHSVAGLEPRLPGATVLTACGGSGMDAEFLARAGARVIASDISLGAARRTSERARRRRLAVRAVVADVERLPFGDRSVDLVYVHDGLHHLADPLSAIPEMARVAAGAVAISEPARATLTSLSVHLGISVRREESGNAVARIEPETLTRALDAEGLSVIGADRYAMFYRHEPGPAMRALSAPVAFTAARAAIVAFNSVLGRIGNKLAVRAVRARSDH